MRLLVRRRGRPVYPASTQRPLSDNVPATPAAVMLFDAGGRLRCLALDLDAAKAGADQVASDAAEAVQLLTEAGLCPFIDVSPSGGRHVYAPLPHPAPAHEVAQVATALSKLLPSLDPSPLLNPGHGCLRPPGAAHKAGGHQRLLTPAKAVAAALSGPVARHGWVQLRRLLRADAITVNPPTPAVDAAPAAGLPRRGITADIDDLAVTGRHPTRSYASASEARMAVIGTAVRAGWGLADIEVAVTTRWRWLHRRLVDKYGPRWRTRIAREFTKAKNSRAEQLCRRPVRDSDTSPRSTRGAAPHDTSALPLTGTTSDPWLMLRKFFTFTTDYARRRRFTPTQRSVIRAVIWVGQVRGSLVVNAGCRSIAEQAGCHHDTVAATLHELADHGLVTRIRHHHGVEADLWQLNVDVAEQARPVRGRITGLHPAFRVIGADDQAGRAGGHDAAEVHDQLSRCPTPLTAAAIATTLGYARSRIHELLRLLAGWDLAQRVGSGWIVGAADLDTLSRRLGGHDHWQAQHDRHVHHRARWRDALLAKGHLPPVTGQIAWDAEFAVVSTEQDAWVQEHVSGTAPPNGAAAVELVQKRLGGQVIA